MGSTATHTGHTRCMKNELGLGEANEISGLLMQQKSTLSRPKAKV